jgi:hypothetical protein
MGGVGELLGHDRDDDSLGLPCPLGELTSGRVATIMWDLGVLLLLLLAGGGGLWLFLSRKGACDEQRAVPAWGRTISSVAASHTQVAGVLAGFSITAVVLVADLSRDGRGAGDVLASTTLGLFTTAFFGYIATGILFAMSVERADIQKYFLYSVASILYYFSVSLSFVALLLLVSLIDHPELERLVALMVAGSVAGGYAAAGIPLYDLLKVRLSRLLLVLLLAAVLSLAAFWGLPGLRGPERLVSMTLPLCVAVISLTFFLAVATFFSRKLERAAALVPLVLVLATAITSLLVYLALVVIAGRLGG